MSVIEIGARFIEAAETAIAAPDINPDIFIQGIELRGSMLDSDRFIQKTFPSFNVANSEQNVGVIRRTSMGNLELAQGSIIILQAIVIEDAECAGGFGGLRRKSDRRFSCGTGASQLCFAMIGVKIFLGFCEGERAPGFRVIRIEFDRAP